MHKLKLFYCSILAFICFTFSSQGKLSYNIYSKIGLTHIYSLQYAINYFISPLTLLVINYFISNYRLGIILYIGIFRCFTFLFGAELISLCENSQNMFCDKYVLESIIAIESLLGGIASCFFFVGFPVYINSISDQQNKPIYFGIAYTIYNCSGLVGNLCGYFLSDKFEPTYYYGILLISLSVCQFLYLCLPDIREKQQNPNQNIFLTFKSEIQGLMAVFKNIKYQPFSLFTLFGFMVQSSYYVFIPTFLKYIQNGLTDDENTFIFYIIGDSSCIFGSLLLGLIVKKYGVFIGIYVMVFFIICFSVILIMSYAFFSIQYLFLSALPYGLYVSSISSVVPTYTTQLISEKTEYFVANDICQCVGWTISSTLYLIVTQFDIITDFSISFSFIVFLLIFIINLRLRQSYQINCQINDITSSKSLVTQE